MNIQLYLADQELELNDKFSFPLNKTFENLNNPTDIIVDYSKSINVPITIHNNKIFSNAYRLDKAVVGSSSDNIGMYLNPTKRIPFRMLHNGMLLMEGYAKFVSATNSVSNRYYTINLFGIIGEVFHELMNVVTDPNKLNGKDYKYVLDDSKYFNTAGNILNKSFVRNSWEHDSAELVTYEQGKYKDFEIFDMYGFAPSHRGLYKDFKSNQIQVSDSSIKPISEILKTAWNDENDSFGADNLVGDGFPDYQINQFVSTRLKPYVYFNHLMRMYVDKCKELTGYTLNLDKDWFNTRNPYWKNTIYMLDFLDLDVMRQQNTNTAILVGETEEVQSENSVVSTKIGSLEMKTVSVASNANYGGKISTGKIDINFGISATHTKAYKDNSLSKNKLSLDDNTQVRFQINVNRISDGASSTVKTLYYWTNVKNNKNLSDSETYNNTNFIQCSHINKDSYTDDRFVTVRYYVTIPDITVEADFSGGYSIDVITSYYNNVGKTNENIGGLKYTGPVLYNWDWQYSSNYLAGRDYIYSTTNELEGAGERGSVNSKGNNTEWFVSVSNSKYLKNWNKDIKVNINNLYQQEDPLFNAIIQYTKMFGLIWDVDYANKTISINTRYNVFKDRTITNWDDKLDRSKDMVIEPITFNNKCVIFNYKNVDGNRYSTYRDKYGLNIGEKKLYTEYDFNTNDKTLFKDIYPSSASSNVYVPYKTLINWNTIDALITTQEQRIMIDCASEDEKNSISLNNWYFRGDNITDNDVVIIEETPLMASSNTYCYIDKTYGMTAGYVNNPNCFPTISTTIKCNGITYGMFFNTPNADYTYTGELQHTLNTNIYDLFWRDYINEKYNIQNKKVTAYFNLTPTDYNSFTINKLVVLQNQVFLVNKIIDYNLNTRESTKCELVQINDLNALSSKIF